uniref:RNase H type-1 domain-containing protein n=1 Tax=Cajanus cajan TaxID=3821 RepID=A0A151R7E0_CAJCA|nr:hypothetical protein KK1_040197 [Cajanus cajan]
MHLDGSVLGCPRPVGYSGLCKDSSGGWLMGFYGDVGVVDNLRVELAGILKGLELA